MRRDPRTGALRRRAGCVSERDVGGCTPARGLFGAHRLTLTRDGRFGYVAGKQDNTQGRRSSVAIFRRDAATGALRQLPGRAGCIMERAADGCAPGRVIGGAHAIMLGPGERTAYLSSDRTDTGGIAIFRRDRRTGALRQLRGRFGGLAPTAADRCTPYRRTGGIHFMVRTRDGRFVYSAVENQYAVLALRAVR